MTSVFVVRSTAVADDGLIETFLNQPREGI